VKWQKPPEKLVRFFEEKAAPLDCERRKMFGYPCAFKNGNMFFGTFEDGIFLRMGQEGVVKARAMHKEIKPFEPRPGRPMREYMVLPEKIFADDSVFDPLLEESLRYAATLPPKKARAKA
jgi:TfoX/Sxy family transcriptional regulator of competence genes